MYDLKTQQHVRFATIEKPTAWVVVAFLVEENGSETTILSEPKVVKIIPKEQVAPALAGAVSKIQKKIFALGSGIKKAVAISTAIPSPYVSEFFKELDFTPTIYARPPTVVF